ADDDEEEELVELTDRGGERRRIGGSRRHGCELGLQVGEQAPRSRQLLFAGVVEESLRHRGNQRPFSSVSRRIHAPWTVSRSLRSGAESSKSAGSGTLGFLLETSPPMLRS